MSEYIIKSYNCETGEEEIREMTSQEIENHLRTQQEYAKNKELKQKEAELIATKRAELLARLGISEEEARLLLG